MCLTQEIEYGLKMKHLHLFFVLQFVSTGFCQSESQPEVKAPQTVTLTTKDNVQLHLQYFAGNLGKETVPVILVHGADGSIGFGSGRDFKDLAPLLQRNGFAVFVPDLRGFGESKQQVGRKGVESIDRSRFNRDDIAKMVKFDMEAVKRFILDKHNTGELNVEQLCLLGCEMGTVIALDWARLDWNAPSFPQLKQGQDVKTMILVSPIQSHLGFTISAAIADKNVQGAISTMVVVGERSQKIATLAARIFKRLKRAHRQAGVGRTSYETLAFHELPTSLQGTKLLNAKSFQLDKTILEFLVKQSAQNAEQHPWKPRKRK